MGSDLPDLDPQMRRLLEETTGRNFLGTGLENEISAMTPKAQATKKQSEKMDYIKSKSFCIAKNNHSQGDNYGYSL